MDEPKTTLGLRAVTLTAELREKYARVQQAAVVYPNDDDGYLPLEALQLDLARAFVAEAALQEVRRIARLGRLPARASGMVGVVEVTLRPKRRVRA